MIITLDMDFGNDILNSSSETPTTWGKWTALEIREMSKLVKYHTDVIAYITLCRGNELSSDPEPKTPRSDIMKQLYLEKRQESKAFLQLLK